ncbi:hypothetical protein [Rheinheimera gaetbuli]
MAKFITTVLFALLLLCCISLPVYGNTLSITLLDQHKRPLSDAVVEIVHQQSQAVA